MAVATLSIDLIAELAKFEQGMRDAVSIAQRASEGMDRAFTTSKIATGTFLGSAAASAVKTLFTEGARLLPELVNDVAGLQDLEEKTGASAVALAGMRTAADVTGLSVDQLAGFMVKLTGSLSKTVDETKGAGPALKALGLELETFRKLTPEDQFRVLAERLAGFQDGAGKTAIALALMGKGGAEALPFLKELAQTSQTQIRLTADQIKLADDYADRQAKVRSELRQAAQVAAIQALPAFIALSETFRDTAKEAVGLGQGATALSANKGVSEWAREAASALGFVVDAGQGVTRVFQVTGTVVGALAAQAGAVWEGEFDRARRIAAEAKADIDRILQKPLFSEGLGQRLDQQRQQEQQAAAFVGPQVPDRRPSLSFAAPDNEALKGLRAQAQQQKALLDGVLKDLEGQLRLERDAVQFHNQFLDAVYGQGLVGLRDYYDAKRDLAQRDLSQQLAILGQERNAVQGALFRTRDPLERIRLQTQLADVDAKVAKAQQDAAQRSVLAGLEEQRAYDAAREQVIEFNARVLELQGNLAEAARLRAELAIAQAQRSASQIGLPVESVDRFAQAQRDAAALGTIQQELQRINRQSAAEEERFTIDAQQRSATTLDTERGLFERRQAALQQLIGLRDRVGAIATAAGPDSPAAQFFEELGLQVQRATANLDPGLQRLRAFTDEAAGAFAKLGEDIVLNFRDAKSALKGFEDQLAALITRELVTRPLQDYLRKFLADMSQGSSGIGQALQSVFGVQTAGGGGSTAGGAVSGGAVGAVAQGVSGAAADTASATAFTTAVTGASTAFSGAVTGSGTGFAGAVTGAGTSMSTALSIASSEAASALIAGAQAAAASLASGAAAGGAAGAVGATFATGGWTGPGASDTQVAGVVHANEYVFSAPAVRSIGVNRLEEWHREARRGAPRLLVPGYANGGFVRAMDGSGASSSASASRQRDREDRRPIVINFTLQGNPTRDTQQQIAAKVARGLEIASRRR
jgi:hypothetical protein